MMTLPPSAVSEKDKDYTEKVVPLQSQEPSEIERHAKCEKGEDEASKLATHRIEISAEASRNVCRKIDLHMLPWLCIVYGLQYLDKTALSYASSMGIKSDTGMSKSQYSLTGTIFYIGYLVFEYPHNRLMQRLPLGKYISASVIIWGAILSAMAGTFNAAGILAVRFFMGGLEGAVTAGKFEFSFVDLSRILPMDSQSNTLYP